MKKPALRPALALGVALTLSLLVPVAMAWACVPYPMIVVGPRSSGPAGTDIKVSGVSFNPGRIEVRWNSIDGPVLGTASDPDFSVDARVPQAEQGMYAIVALTRDGDGGVSSLARASFLVTESSGVSTRPSPATGEDSPGEPPAGAGTPNRIGLLLVGGGLVGVGVCLGALLFRRGRAKQPDQP